jgi:hypothetical protein
MAAYRVTGIGEAGDLFGRLSRDRADDEEGGRDVEVREGIRDGPGCRTGAVVEAEGRDRLTRFELPTRQVWRRDTTVLTTPA